MKIALYKRNDYLLVSEAKDWMATDTDYVRLSEIVDIDWPMLPPEVVVPQELATLDKAEAELVAKYTEALTSLQNRRKDLLALAPPKAVTEAA